MKADVKTKWVAALRSGEYIQGTSVLRTYDNRFCCLGVLADLNAKETGRKWDFYDGRYFYDFKYALISEEVEVWAGFSERMPEVVYNGTLESLAILNDRGMKFAEIADLIEEQL